MGQQPFTTAFGQTGLVLLEFLAGLLISLLVFFIFSLILRKEGEGEPKVRPMLIGFAIFIAGVPAALALLGYKLAIFGYFWWVFLIPYKIIRKKLKGKPLFRDAKPVAPRERRLSWYGVAKTVSASSAISLIYIEGTKLNHSQAGLVTFGTIAAFLLVLYTHCQITRYKPLELEDDERLAPAESRFVRSIAMFGIMMAMLPLAAVVCLPLWPLFGSWQLWLSCSALLLLTLSWGLFEQMLPKREPVAEQSS